jgi:hypothetical protein
MRADTIRRCSFFEPLENAATKYRGSPFLEDNPCRAALETNLESSAERADLIESCENTEGPSWIARDIERPGPMRV